MSLRIFFSVCVLFLGACQAAPEPQLLTGDGTQAAFATFGYERYCAAAKRRNAAQDRAFRTSFCEGGAERATVDLTEARAATLAEVQSRVNAMIRYRPTTSWDPLRREGDCKTYAARKQLELVERGFPVGALRIATAFVNDGSPEQNQYHTVLLVDTDRGTLVLDNRQAAPRPWKELAYLWMTAQVPGEARWERLPADPTQVAVVMAANTRRPAAALR